MSENKIESIFLPSCIGLCALVLWFGFQTAQLSQERTSLGALAGNQNAAQIVEALKQRGVTIDASKAPTTATSK
jgi:hypothetical protein